MCRHTTYMETTTCHFCSRLQTYKSGWVNAAHWTETGWVRADACGDCRPMLTLRAPQAPRKPKAKAPALYGDFAYLAKFSGIATDGSGRVNAR